MNTLNPTHEMALRGLHNNQARDFLAAIGLLRLLDILWPEHSLKLGWSTADDSAVVVGSNGLPEKWPSILADSLKSLVELTPNPIAHGSVIKTDFQTYRKATLQAKEFAKSDHPLSSLPVLLYSAYSSQIPTDSGDVDPCLFSFGNGQGGKNLLLDVNQLITKIDGAEVHLALQGKAQPCVAKTLRWNPKEYRPAAYRSHDPGSGHKGDDTLDLPALNVLAFIGISFYPTVPTETGGQTAGFFRQERQTFFTWPVWTGPLNQDEIFSLVGSDLAHLGPECGVSRVWRSRRFSADKSLYFAPAEILR